MKLGPFDIRLAEKKSPAKIISGQLGATGTTNYAGIISDTYHEYNSKLVGTRKYAVYNEMRMSDGQIKAVLLFCKLPIRAAAWFVEPASQEEEDLLIARFVSWNLFERMSTSWKSLLDNALLSLDFGFSLAEKVWAEKIETWTDSETGKVFDVRPFKKLAPRLPWTVYRWIVAEDEGLEAIEQRVYKNGSYHTLTIGIDKLLLWNIEQEGANYEGISLLRPAFKPWFFKKTAELIQNMGYERWAMGIPVFTLPEGVGIDDDEADAAREVLQSLRSHEKGYIIEPFGWKFRIEGGTGKWSSAEEIIRQQNQEISKAVLQQFTHLGTTETGSRAVGEILADPYYLALESVADGIAEVINKYLIPQLVQMNFQAKRYPLLKHGDIKKKNLGLLDEMLAKLVPAGVITSDAELEAYIRKLHDLPERQEEEIKEKEKIKLSEKRREFFWYEKKVNFAEIESKMNSAEKEFYSAARKVLDEQIKDYLALLKPAIKNRDIGKLGTISFKKLSKFAAAIKGVLRELFAFGREQVREEAKKALKLTELSQIEDNFDATEYFSTVADEIAKIISSKMDFTAKKIALAGIIGGKPPGDIFDEIASSLDDFADKELRAQASFSTVDALTLGRGVEAKARETDVKETVYSAILDERTCDICTSLDGQRHEGVWAWGIPQHHNCRCVEVYVFVGEEEAVV